jgi:uncharacterized delta-60 repeat protein
MGATGRSLPRASAGCRPHLEVLEDRCLPSGGVLDPTTFGTGGAVISSLGSSTIPYAVATYPQAGTANDGKIVVAGMYAGPNHKYQFGIVRYNLDGSLDTSFGSNGEVTGPLGEARAVLIQPDGKVLAAGDSGGYAFAVVRYNANGSLDTTFGSRGEATTTITANGYDEIWAMGLQADGKIVVAGGTTPPNSAGSRQLAVLRYNANGTLDTSFGTGGKALNQLALSPRGSGYMVMGLAIDPGTGQIVVEAAANSASGPYPTMVVRYTSAGVLDQSFAKTGATPGYEIFDGTTLPSLWSRGTVAIQPSDHKIVVAGGTYGSYEGLARLNTDGTLDGGLKVTSTFANNNIYTVKIQASGGILVGAHGYLSAITVARYNSDLTPDTSFGASGVASYNNSNEAFEDMALEPDGRIVLVGNHDTGYFDVTLTRFLSTVPQITSFSASPNPVTTGSSVTLTASNIIDPTPNSSITQVAFYLDSNGDGILEPGTDTLLGYGTQTSPGVWTYTFPVTQTSGSYTLFAQAEDSYGVFGDPLAITLTVS